MDAAGVITGPQPYLCLFGILVAALYQFRVAQIDEAREFRAAKADAERQKKIDEAQRNAMEAQADLRAIEKSNGNQIVWLQKRLDKVIASAQSLDQKSVAREVKDELAALTESLKQQMATYPPTILITAPSTQPAVSSPALKSCRGDTLDQCSDQELLEWGGALMEKIEQIENAHMANLKSLDDIKGKTLDF